MAWDDWVKKAVKPKRWAPQRTAQIAQPWNAPQKTVAPPAWEETAPKEMGPPPAPMQSQQGNWWDPISVGRENFGTFWARIQKDWTGTRLQARQLHSALQQGMYEGIDYFKQFYNPVPDVGDYDHRPLEMRWDDEAGIYGIGYYDENGNWVYTKDYTNIKAKLDELYATDIPRFDESGIMDIIGSEAFDRITEIADQGGLSDEDYQRALEATAALSGLSMEEFEGLNTDLSRAMMGGGPTVMGTPVTEAQQEAIERTTAIETRRREALAERQLNAMQAGGRSSAEYYRKAEEFRDEIQDSRIQGQMAMAQMNFEQNARMYENLTGTKQQQLEVIERGYDRALQGYALEINSMFQQNQDYFQAYQADLQGAIASMDATYKAIMAEIGVDTAMAEGLAAQLDAEWADFYADLDAHAAQIALQQLQQEAQPDVLGDILGFLGVGASIIATIFGFATANPLMVGAGLAGIGTSAGIFS